MKQLRVHGIFGFGGNVPSGLKYHPDRKHLIYPIGSTVLVKNLKTDECQFLRGHDGPVSCIAVSRSGRYIASGQTTHLGFKAAVIIWDYETRQLLYKFVLHKVTVKCLSFSRDEKYLVSVGGNDDNNVIVWSVETGRAICGDVSTPQDTCVSYFNKTSKYILLGGKYSLRVWEIDYENRKLIPHLCNLGQYKRIITCLVIDKDDQYAYCGTTSGDVIAVQLTVPRNYKFSGPRKRISLGIRCIGFTAKGNIVLGGGRQSLIILRRKDLAIMKNVKLGSSVTSISGSPSGHYYVGTGQSEIFYCDKNFNPTLIQTCHCSRVNDVTFPDNCSEIVGTCSAGDIRIWSTKRLKELVRIELQNLECNRICFSHRGHLVVSGWSDGRVRGFGPETGELKFEIDNAHKVPHHSSSESTIGSGNLTGVTALAMFDDDTRVLTGGSDGQLRIWRLHQGKQTLEVSMKQHKATINRVVLNRANTHCITASDDGSCIIWDLEKHTRENIMYQTTYFKGVCWLNDESQILTCGTNKLVTNWDSFDCHAIREIDASSAEVNSVDMSPSGDTFACGANDQKLSIWDYDEGEMVAEGVGHSGDVLTVKFSPDDKLICSAGDDGSIILWENIQMVQKNEDENVGEFGDGDEYMEDVDGIQMPNGDLEL